jgi:hypothetical protein
MTDIEKDPACTKFIEQLYQAQQDKRAAHTLGNLISLYKTKPSFAASRPCSRLSELADLAAWRASDPDIPRPTREQYHAIARTIDIMTTGKSSRPETLPKYRRAQVSL